MKDERTYTEADMAEAYRMGCRAGAMRTLKLVRNELDELVPQARSAFAEATLPKLLRERGRPLPKDVAPTDPAPSGSGIAVTASPLARRNNMLAEAYGSDLPIGPPVVLDPRAVTRVLDRPLPPPQMPLARRRPWGRNALTPSQEEHGEKRLGL